MHNNKSLSSPGLLMIFRILFLYWRGREKWIGGALLALCMAFTLGLVTMNVWSNKINGEVMDALMNANWQALKMPLLLSLLLTLCNITLSVIYYAATQILQLRWRTWLTHRLIKRWTKDNAFYHIERENLLTNADQRVSEDINSFVQTSLDLFLGTITAVSSFFSFAFILWTLSGSLSFSLIGVYLQIPGYLFFSAIIYGLGHMAVTWWAGNALIGLNKRSKTVEADFRYLGMRLRENAEQIAFYRGGNNEYEQLHQGFSLVRENTLDIIKRYGKLMYARSIYSESLSIVPTLLILPRYLSHAVSLGDITRAAGAFNAVYSSITYFSQAWDTLTEWLAVGGRLSEMEMAINKVNQIQSQCNIIHGPNDVVSIEQLFIYTPDGTPLTYISNLSFCAGQRWLIKGASGTGKSTLFRTIAGLWPYASGTIKYPQHVRCFFLPQRSYIPPGSLKQALCYPSSEDEFSDKQCCKVLQQVLLTTLIPKLHVSTHWQQKLSGGEQQRLAIARMLLQSPHIIFMDEATSALDKVTEHHVYAEIIDTLPDSTLVSIAHNPELEPIHTHSLELKSLRQINSLLTEKTIEEPIVQKA